MKNQLAINFDIFGECDISVEVNDCCYYKGGVQNLNFIFNIADQNQLKIDFTSVQGHVDLSEIFYNHLSIEHFIYQGIFTKQHSAESAPGTHINVNGSWTYMFDSELGKHMNFIEIGSNEYDTMLHSKFFSVHAWGIIVEPLNRFLNNLPVYDNVTYLNCAVTANYDGRADFYAPIDHPTPEWVKSVGSLHADHPTLKNLSITDQIVKTQVDAISLLTLYNQIPDNNIHFLKLDTEGNDFDLLYNWDFDRFTPLHIQFESKLMSSIELEKLIKLLETHGYSVVEGQKKRLQLNCV